MRSSLLGLLALVACAHAGPSQQLQPTFAASPIPAVPNGPIGIVVTAESTLGRPVDLVAVIDSHSSSGTEQAAIAELEAWAQRLGGVAVLEARFEAATKGSPAHVSGVVVRERAVDPRPYEELARIDVQTDEDAPAKGMDALRQRAAELGADKVVDIRFEHDGDDGRSHLRGVAVRYRR